MEWQSYAYGKNHWTLDPDLKPVLLKYWPEVSQFEEQLERFGELAGGRAYEIADYVDRTASPELVMYDIDGKRVDRARLDPAHAQLLRDIAFINRPPYEGSTWGHHFAFGYLLADTGLYCSLIVTNQTAYAIYKYAPEHEDWLRALLSGDAWGATWMSEVHGGSDLGANKTSARQDGLSWRLDGDDKYFASNAGLADFAIVTARPEGAPGGPKGLELYLVPRIDSQGELNFRIRRLKRKSATRAVPTGEVEFHNTEAYLIGEAGLGIYYTLENLTVSRLANAAGAMGLARKAHLETLFRVRARQSFGLPLCEHPLVRYDLADMAVRTAAGLALTFKAIEAFDRVWKVTPPYTNAYHYARFLSHLAKNRTADHATHTTQLAMELFGGVGFMEDFAISRLHRESLVTAIWEGSSNIQALELLESIQKKKAHLDFMAEFTPIFDRTGTPEAILARDTVINALDRLASSTAPEAQWYGKEALTSLADAAQVACLYELAEAAGNRPEGERYARLAALYAEHFLLKKPYPAWVLKEPSIWYPMDAEIQTV